MAKTELTAQQRQQLFAQMTRQTFQPIAPAAGVKNSRVTLQLPQSRLLSKVRLMVQATINAKHATNTSYVPADMAPYSLIDSIRLEMNNGFSPITVTGKELYMHNLTRQRAHVLDVQTSGRGKNVQGLVASAGGTDNTVRFQMELPISLNDRDAIGLILLQNRETVANIHVTFADENALVKSGQAGYTFTVSNILVTPHVETFTIPNVPEAMPDLSVLKLVQSTSYPIAGAGEAVMKLPVGTTYRKLIFFVEDANGGVDDSFITSDIELVINQADSPYRVHPLHLASINQEQYAKTLPKGMYVFEFTDQGIVNYGGGRDYIDTERLTEFWLRFKVSGACTVRCVYETLSRLR